MKPISTVSVTYSRVLNEYTVEAYGYTKRGTPGATALARRRFKTEADAKDFVKVLSKRFITSEALRENRVVRNSKGELEVTV